MNLVLRFKGRIESAFTKDLSTKLEEFEEMFEETTKMLTKDIEMEFGANKIELEVSHKRIDLKTNFLELEFYLSIVDENKGPRELDEFCDGVDRCLEKQDRPVLSELINVHWRKY